MRTIVPALQSVLFLLLTQATLTVGAQDSQLGDGYVLVSPLGHPSSYLVDSDKNIVHRWDCGSGPANARYLLPDGSLLCTSKVENPRFPARGGPGGKVSRVNKESEIVWEYQVSDDSMLAHHDVEPLPNGNVLVIAWEYHSSDEAVRAGRKPETMRDPSLWAETILEIKPVGRDQGEVVWRWSLWDHLIQSHDASKDNYGSVGDHPELVDINFGIRGGGADWIHMNAVHYNAEQDLIALSARWFDEVWVIDHSTTTDQASSHAGGKHGKGGDLIYRWGNPQSYLGGFPSDRKFFAQHDVRWIESDRPGGGDMMVFNNGDRNVPDRNYSSVDQFELPLRKDGTFELSATEPYGPRSYVWSYSAPDYFTSQRISGAERLPGGNTLICSGDQGLVFEVTPGGKRVWEMRIEDLATNGGARSLFRAPFYQASHPGVKAVIGSN